jgi:hypothetical protein
LMIEFVAEQSDIWLLITEGIAPGTIDGLRINNPL